MEKLLTMTEFVIWLDKNPIEDNNNQYDSMQAWERIIISNYAQLLQTLLSLSQFIPCDEDGSLSVEPTMSNPEAEAYPHTIYELILIEL